MNLLAQDHVYKLNPGSYSTDLCNQKEALSLSLLTVTNRMVSSGGWGMERETNLQGLCVFIWQHAGRLPFF